LFYSVVAIDQGPILAPDQLIAVLVDLELTRTIAYQDIPYEPELAQAIFEEQAELIFKAHAMDRALFQESYLHYLNDPKQFKSLHDKLITQLEKLLQEAQEAG
jgi:hypothetical protein